MTSTGSLESIKKPTIKEKDTLDAAPAVEPKTIFVMFDPTGLLGQLFLLNRNIGSTNVSISLQDERREDTTTVLDTLDTTLLDEMDGPIFLRELARLFIRDADESDDPSGMYDLGIEKIQALDIEEGTRLESTQRYVIRIFEQRQRQYEETIMRDIVNTRPEGTFSSANSDDLEDS